MASTASIDLDAMTAKQLTDLIQAAEAKRQDKAHTERAALLQEMTKRAEDLGLTLHELVGAPTTKTTATRRSNATKKVSAKYRGPNGEEWTGRGRMPNWLVAQEAEGKKRDSFLIK